MADLIEKHGRQFASRAELRRFEANSPLLQRIQQLETERDEIKKDRDFWLADASSVRKQLDPFDRNSTHSRMCMYKHWARLWKRAAKTWFDFGDWADERLSKQNAELQRLRKIEEAARPLLAPLTHGKEVPCLSELLGEDPDPQCGCLGCISRRFGPALYSALEAPDE